MARTSPTSLVTGLARHPLELTPTGSYPEVCAVLMGYDETFGRGAFVRPFQTWLEQTFDLDPNVVFWHHIAKQAWPALGAGASLGGLTTADHRRAIALLIDHLRSFLSAVHVRPTRAESEWTSSAVEALARSSPRNTRFLTWADSPSEGVALLVGMANGIDATGLHARFAEWVGPCLRSVGTPIAVPAPGNPIDARMALDMLHAPADIPILFNLWADYARDVWSPDTA